MTSVADSPAALAVLEALDAQLDEARRLGTDLELRVLDAVAAAVQLRTAEARRRRNELVASMTTALADSWWPDRRGARSTISSSRAERRARKAGRR